MTFIKLGILLVLCILAIKLSSAVITAVRVGHSVMKVLIAPIKRIYVWEYNNFKVLLINLFLQKSDVFKSLISHEEVGIVRENIDNPIHNNLISGLFHLSWQILGIIILSTQSWSDLYYVLPDIKQNLFIVFISVIISAIYVRFKIVKVTPIENALFKSTMPFDIQLASRNKADE